MSVIFHLHSVTVIMDLGLEFDDEDFKSKKENENDKKKSYNAKVCNEFVSSYIMFIGLNLYLESKELILHHNQLK